MLVQVLGSGCKKCNDLYESARAAAGRDPSGDHVVEKVDDVDVFLRLGVRVTPALVLDGEVISTGKVLTADEVAAAMGERAGRGE
ncbi:MAG: thioredoxin family protein [Thermoleophilia bacterium]